jgi:hypothetical protein
MFTGGELIAKANAGNGQHFNNPASDRVENHGPPPRNFYRISEIGRATYGGTRLTPEDESRMRATNGNQRAGFLIHGGIYYTPGKSRGMESMGCIAFTTLEELRAVEDLIRKNKITRVAVFDSRLVPNFDSKVKDGNLLADGAVRHNDIVASLDMRSSPIQVAQAATVPLTSTAVPTVPAADVANARYHFEIATFKNSIKNRNPNPTGIAIPENFDVTKNPTIVVAFHGDGATLERDVIGRIDKQGKFIAPRQNIPAQAIAGLGNNTVVIAPKLEHENVGNMDAPGFARKFIAEASERMAKLYNAKRPAGTPEITPQHFANANIVMMNYSAGHQIGSTFITNALNDDQLKSRFTGVAAMDSIYSSSLAPFIDFAKRDGKALYTTFTGADRRIVAQNNAFVAAVKEAGVTVGDTPGSSRVVVQGDNDKQHTVLLESNNRLANVFASLRSGPAYTQLAMAAPPANGIVSDTPTLLAADPAAAPRVLRAAAFAPPPPPSVPDNAPSKLPSAYLSPGLITNNDVMQPWTQLAGTESIIYDPKIRAPNNTFVSEEQAQAALIASNRFDPAAKLGSPVETAVAETPPPPPLASLTKLASNGAAAGVVIPKDTPPDTQPGALPRSVKAAEPVVVSAPPAPSFMDKMRARATAAMAATASKSSELMAWTAAKYKDVFASAEPPVPPPVAAPSEPPPYIFPKPDRTNKGNSLAREKPAAAPGDSVVTNGDGVSTATRVAPPPVVAQVEPRPPALPLPTKEESLEAARKILAAPKQPATTDADVQAISAEIAAKMAQPKTLPAGKIYVAEPLIDPLAGKRASLFGSRPQINLGIPPVPPNAVAENVTPQALPPPKVADLKSLSPSIVLQANDKLAKSILNPPKAPPLLPPKDDALTKTVTDAFAQMRQPVTAFNLPVEKAPAKTIGPTVQAAQGLPPLQSAPPPVAQAQADISVKAQANPPPPAVAPRQPPVAAPANNIVTTQPVAPAADMPHAEMKGLTPHQLLNYVKGRNNRHADKAETFMRQVVGEGADNLEGWDLTKRFIEKTRDIQRELGFAERSSLTPAQRRTQKVIDGAWGRATQKAYEARMKGTHAEAEPAIEPPKPVKVTESPRKQPGVDGPSAHA